MGLMRKKKILVVGRSCAGKSSIVNEVCKRLGLKQVKSYTTRPRRPGEKDTISDHYFISDDEFVLYKEDTIAYTEINGAKYFATRSELEASDIYVIDPNGIEDLKRRCGDEFQFVVIYIRVPKSISKKRADQRGDKDYNERSEKEAPQFDEFEKKMAWDYHILNNGTFESAVNTMEKMVRKELNI